MFVGASRRAQVDRLLRDFRRVTATREPGMVVFVAAPGTGKTRIIQEFNRGLAAAQPDPAYWPASLLDDAPDGGLGLRELTNSRKTVRYQRTLAAPADAPIPWLWLARASGRLSDGSPAPAFDGVVAQFLPHVPALLRRLAAAGTASPARAAEIESAIAGLAAGAGRSEDRPAQFSGLLTLLISPAGPAGDNGVPLVLVLDDAHELDEPTVGFVSELLASELPVLVVATTWPDRLTPVGGEPLSPFCDYLTTAGGSDRIAPEWLGQLEEDDLIGYILGQFPATDQKVAGTLVWRADRNPYALRLLLNLPRVTGSVRAGAITLDPLEIESLNGKLDSLLAEHWEALPAGVRQVLVAAALLGQSFLDEVLEAGLRRLRPPAAFGVDDALGSSWIRQLGGSERIMEFAERLRFDIARGGAPDFLSDAARADVCSGALRALRRMLPGEPEGTGRIVLLALHVLLAREGIEDDLAAAAASAAELAERARSEFRRVEGLEYYRQAITWVEASKSAPMRPLVDYLCNYSAMNRIHHGRADGEPMAQRAVQLADQYLDDQDELRVHARLALARSRRRLEDAEVFASAQALWAEAHDLLGRLHAPSDTVIRDVRSAEIAFANSAGDFRRGADLSRSLAAFCEERFGRLHRHTLSALTDLGYCLHRVDQDLSGGDGPNDVIAVRRLVLERRIQRFNDAGHLQTVGAKNDLAASLLATRDVRDLAEAERLIEDSITRRARAFSYDSRSCRVSRSLRTRLWMAQGLLAEAAGDAGRASGLFAKTAGETARIRDLRRDERPETYAVSVQRCGEVLACLRDPEAIAVLDEALEIREGQVGQDHTFWAVRDCAKSLWWAYERLGRTAEAEAVARRYHLGSDPALWVPPFVPDTDFRTGSL